jgi:hypothetical protein
MSNGMIVLLGLALSMMVVAVHELTLYLPPLGLSLSIGFIIGGTVASYQDRLRRKTEAGTK